MLCINGDTDKTYTYEQLQTKSSLANHVKEGLKRCAELKSSTSRVEDSTDIASVLKERSREFEFVVDDCNARKKEFKKKFESVGVVSRFFALMTMGTSVFLADLFVDCTQEVLPRLQDLVNN